MSSPPDPYSSQHGGPPPAGGYPPAGAPRPYGAPQPYASAAPPPRYGPLTPPPRPGSVRAAVLLMWGGAALSLVSVISSFTVLGQTRAMITEELATPGLEVPPELIDASLAAGIGIAVLLGLLGAALWALNAVFCRRGAQWSRVLGTVLGGVYLLNSVFSFLQPTPTIAMVLLVLTLLVVLATILTLWLPASNAWFGAVRAIRRPAAPPPPPGG